MKLCPSGAALKSGFFDGRPSRYFYWDGIPGRLLNPEQVDSEKALERARALARVVRDKLDSTDFVPGSSRLGSEWRSCSSDRSQLLEAASMASSKAASRRLTDN